MEDALPAPAAPGEEVDAPAPSDFVPAPDRLGGSPLPGTCPGGDWGWVCDVFRGTLANSLCICFEIATAGPITPLRDTLTLWPATRPAAMPVTLSEKLPGPPENTAADTRVRVTFTPISVPRTPSVASGVSSLKRLGSIVVTRPVMLRNTPTPSLQTADTVLGWAGS